MLVIPALRRLKQEDCQVLEAILAYIMSSRSTWNGVKSSFTGGGGGRAYPESVFRGGSRRILLSSRSA